MKRTSRLAKIKVILFCLLTLVFIFGCKGSDTREQVDDVVEEAAGKKNVERMQTELVQRGIGTCGIKPSEFLFAKIDFRR